MKLIKLFATAFVALLALGGEARSQTAAAGQPPVAAPREASSELDDAEKDLAKTARSETLAKMRAEVALKRSSLKKARPDQAMQLNLEIKSLNQNIAKCEKWTLAQWLADLKTRQKNELEELQRKERQANAPPEGSREEFKSLVRRGMTFEEVISAVGRPTTTGDRGGSTVFWHYRERTTDMITGKKDWAATVVFDEGKVNHVRF
jgi:hypothetical protein